MLPVAAACRRPPAPATAEAAGRSAANAPAAEGGPLNADETRELCLSEDAPRGVAERELRSGRQQALALPGKPEPWVGLGQQWVRVARAASDPGFYLNVGACAAVALAAAPGYRPALGLRALGLMNDHDFEGARKLSAEVLESDPDDWMALGTLSDALLELGRYEESAEAAQRQMHVRPAMAVLARGSYLRWLEGDLRGATLLIRDALMDRDARDPEAAAWTFVEAANIYWHKGDYDGADAVYVEALKWVPDYPAALAGRGRIALARHEPAAAISWLERSCRRRPLAETAWLLGDAHEMDGAPSRADAAYADAVRQGRRGDRLTLARFYATKGREVDEALRLAAEERRSRTGIYVEDAYAWALFRAGRTAEARGASDRAIRLGTPDARLLYHAGAIRTALGDASGKRLVERALAQNPAFDWTEAKDARDLLGGAPRRTASR